MDRASERGISTKEYLKAENEIYNLYKSSAINENEILENLNLFTTVQHKKREIFFYEIYKKIIGMRGSIIQFGVRWGRELALFEMLRTIFEPFNHSRSIYGFDTFTGYPKIKKKDQTKLIKTGGLAVSKNYEKYLNKLLKVREQLNPLPQTQKFNLIKGSVENTLEPFLEKNKHQYFAMVHLDLNISSSTKFVIQKIKNRLFKGSIVIVDETCHPEFSGEMSAIIEELSDIKLRFKRIPHINSTWQSYFEVE